ncbi:MAG: hypothetical protein U1F87_18705 [Kiritimatiellia bacterium]
MKSHVIVLALVVGASSSFAQGSLTPPGAPGQTMKSLAQIEPRTVIPGGTAAFVISTPRSYVLGGNLSINTGHAITISANNVTLDLDGFTISSTPPSASGCGITLAPDISNIRITNGHIVGRTTYTAATQTFVASGFECGIGAEGSQTNVEIDYVTVSGTQAAGIYVLNASIHDCSVNICAGDGITGRRVSDCRVDLVGGSGIGGSIISGCHGATIGHLPGSDGISGWIVTDSSGSADTGAGIKATKQVQNSTGVSASGAGISADIVSASHGVSSSGSGITTQVASYSYGSSTTGTAINATRSAIGCTVGSGAVVSPNKLLGTP